MSAETKLALWALGLFFAGVAAIFAGVWPNYKLAAVLVGIGAMIGGVRLFVAIWRGRP